MKNPGNVTGWQRFKLGLAAILLVNLAVWGVFIVSIVHR